MDDDQYTGFLLGLTNQLDRDSRESEIEATAIELDKSPNDIREDFYEILERVIRERVQEFSKPDLSPIKRGDKRSALDAWLKAFISDKKQREDTITAYSQDEEVVELYTIAELIEKAKEKGTRYLVSELFLYGTMILVAAAPKTGKSLFATALAVAVATGQDFFNRKVDQGNVLFIQNEESLIETGRRLVGAGLQNLEVESPELYYDLINSNKITVVRNLDIALDQQKIFELVEQFNISLVIVDSLGASIKKGGLTEYSPEIMGALYGFQTECQDRGIVGVVLHHTTKIDSNADKSSQIKGIAGFNGIVRANDGIIKLEPNLKNQELINFHIVPRNGSPFEIKAYIVKDEALFWNWVIKEETSLSEANIQLQNDVLRLLVARWEVWEEVNKQRSVLEREPVYGYTSQDLLSLLDNTPRENLVERLNAMLSSEGIERTVRSKKHVYHLPPSGETWLLAYLQAEEERRNQQEEVANLEKEMAQLLVDCNTREEIQVLIQDWSKEERKRTLSRLNAPSFNQVMLLMHPPKYVKGDYVGICNQDIIREVTLVEFNPKEKSAKSENKHLYYLEGYETAFPGFQLFKALPPESVDRERDALEASYFQEEPEDTGEEEDVE